jgi:hypothetical protein
MSDIDTRDASQSERPTLRDRLVALASSVLRWQEGMVVGTADGGAAPLPTHGVDRTSPTPPVSAW